jgi:MFS family permease
VILFAAGLAVSGLADSMAFVIAGRAIQGFGSGAIGSVVYAAIARAYAPSARPRMIALVSSAWVVPGLVGPALAGLVADELGWRWVFLGIVAPLLVMGARRLPAAQPARRGRAHTPIGRSRWRRAFDAVQLAVGSTMLIAALSSVRCRSRSPWCGAGGWLAIGRSVTSSRPEACASRPDGRRW